MVVRGVLKSCDTALRRFARIRSASPTDFNACHSFSFVVKIPVSRDIASITIAEKTLSGKRAAWRVHGGGFAGTIQAFVPNEDVAEFRRVMDEALGEGCCMVLRIRPVGAVKI